MWYYWAIQLSLTSAIPANSKKLKKIINFKAYTIFNNLNRNFDQGFLNFYTEHLLWQAGLILISQSYLALSDCDAM